MQTARYPMPYNLQETFLRELNEITTLSDLEGLRLRYFGKQGIITEKLKELGAMSLDQRKARGAELNLLRETCQKALLLRKGTLEIEAMSLKLQNDALDVTLPSPERTRGCRHILTKTRHEIIDYFERFGFIVEEGPDIDDEFHNFDALNMPSHHPARQSHDTFYVDQREHFLLRTHTSTVQIHHFEKMSPPFRVLAEGRVYRADFDATHLPMFHQIEGFVVEEGIHLGHLKGTLTYFLKYFFGKEDLKTRFRPSFFPFTEPSFEIDIWGKNGWLEVLGCGMIHPNVFKNVGLDPKKHQGFAFGMGIDRLTMLKHGITDIRHFVAGDLRWNRRMG